MSDTHLQEASSKLVCNRTRKRCLSESIETENNPPSPDAVKNLDELSEGGEKITDATDERYKPKIKSIVVFMIAMSLVEFAQKDLTGSQFQSLLAAKFGWED